MSAFVVNKCVWIPKPERSFPPTIFSGGLSNFRERMLIARCRHGDNILPGYCLASTGICYTTFGEFQYQTRDCEVLTKTEDHEFQWVLASRGEIVNGAVQGGQTSAGQPLFIGRVKNGDGKLIGYIDPQLLGCFYPFAGRAQRTDVYEVLTCQLIEHGSPHESCEPGIFGGIFPSASSASSSSSAPPAIPVSYAPSAPLLSPDSPPRQEIPPEEPGPSRRTPLEIPPRRNVPKSLPLRKKK